MTARADLVRSGCGAAAAVVGCVAALGPVRGAVAAPVVAVLSVVVLRRLARRAPRVRPDPASPLVLDLVAAVLRAGHPQAVALELAAPAGADSTRAALTRVAALLRRGVGAGEAWQVLLDDPGWRAVAAAARRSADSGVRLADAFERAATEHREGAAAAATRRAERVGVWAAAPLALCFLPSFVCLGIAPVVIGIARSVFGTLR